MRVLIFGLGLNRGGESAARYYLKRGDSVRVSDMRDTPALRSLAKSLEALGASVTLGCQSAEETAWADVVVKNPAVPPSLPVLRGAKRITSDIRCLLESPRRKGVKVIAVTGTKGKTTTATAISEVLRALGHSAELCGNMGISGYDVLSRWEAGARKPEYLVLELSSWQIRDAAPLPPLEACVMTSFFPDHQDFYSSLEEYLKDKLKLFDSQKCVKLVPSFLLGRIPSASPIETRSPLLPPILRAAFSALLALGQDGSEVERELLRLQPVHDRQEVVCRREGILFINDSAATIAEAARFTLSSLPSSSIHVIAGGADKNLSPLPLLEPLSRAKSVTLLDGTFTRGKLIPSLREKGIPFFGPYGTMKEAVERAVSEAREDDAGEKIVILSPGAASFGLFSNEFDRGEQFRQCARAFL